MTIINQMTNIAGKFEKFFTSCNTEEMMFCFYMKYIFEFLKVGIVIISIKEAVNQIRYQYLVLKYSKK